MLSMTSPHFVADFSSTAVALGPLEIKWYGLMYVVGFALGWWLSRWYARRTHLVPTPQIDALVSDLIVWLVAGTIVGGRLGYGVMYGSGPTFDLLKIWEPGMSFHGALVGIIVSAALFARRRRIPFWRLTDMIAVAGTPGLFFGRIGNFINGELWGRVTDVPWAVIFPHAGPWPRHPSQLYEGVLEGLVLFAILLGALRWWHLERTPGRLSGLFLVGYGLARIAVECVREPDAHLGFLWLGLTMGQWLTVPMVVAGLWLLLVRRADAPAS